MRPARSKVRSQVPSRWPAFCERPGGAIPRAFKAQTAPRGRPSALSSVLSTDAPGSSGSQPIDRRLGVCLMSCSTSGGAECGKPLARIFGGESRMAELPDHPWFRSRSSRSCGLVAFTNPAWGPLPSRKVGVLVLVAGITLRRGRRRFRATGERAEHDRRPQEPISPEIRPLWCVRGRGQRRDLRGRVKLGAVPVSGGREQAR